MKHSNVEDMAELIVELTMELQMNMSQHQGALFFATIMFLFLWNISYLRKEHI
jgi:hypothetical protein